MFKLGRKKYISIAKKFEKESEYRNKKPGNIEDIYTNIWMNRIHNDKHYNLKRIGHGYGFRNRMIDKVTDMYVLRLIRTARKEKVSV